MQRKSLLLKFLLFLLAVFFTFQFLPVETSINKDKNIFGKKTDNKIASSPVPGNDNSKEFQKVQLQAQRDKELSRVVRVIDGDTIEVDINGKIDKVRLIGIDSPEVADKKKPVECFGREASSKAKEVLAGESVYLENDSTQGEKDKYGRLLRYVRLENGTNFNKFMIQEGFANEYTYKSSPYKYQREFKNAQKEARENKRGMWGENKCK